MINPISKPLQNFSDTIQGFSFVMGSKLSDVFEDQCRGLLCLDDLSEFKE